MFYERLNEVCKKANTTVTSFVMDILHSSASTASNWKKGTSPNSQAVITAAKHFGVSADYLLGLTDDPIPYHDEYQPTLTADELFYIEKLRNQELDMQIKILISGLVLMGCSPERDQLPSLRSGPQESGLQGTEEQEEKSIS